MKTASKFTFIALAICVLFATVPALAMEGPQEAKAMQASTTAMQERVVAELKKQCALHRAFADLIEKILNTPSLISIVDYINLSEAELKATLNEAALYRERMNEILDALKIKYREFKEMSEEKHEIVMQCTPQLQAKL